MSTEKEAKRYHQRQENFREKKSSQTEENVKKAVYEKLYYGFRRDADAMKSMQIVTTPRSIILPVSTRSIGFHIRFIISKFSRLQIRQIDYHALCWALFRVTLLQFDAKLSMAMRNQFSRNTGNHNSTTMDILPEIFQRLGEIGAYFGPLVNLISSIGIVRAFGAMYIPRLPLMSVVNMVRQYDPTLVSFSSLREYVLRLASDATPTDIRLNFYNHSSLPNAVWDKREIRQRDDQVRLDPILLNPDDIMPSDYDLRDDINIIADAVEVISRKYEKYIHTGGIDYASNGNFTQLVSNLTSTLRCTDLSLDSDGVPNYKITRPIEGEVEYFWSPEHLQDPEFYLDAIHMLGENVESFRASFSVRSLDSAKQEAHIEYVSALQNLLG